jgi:hypothetical protein
MACRASLNPYAGCACTAQRSAAPSVLSAALAVA